MDPKKLGVSQHELGFWQLDPKPGADEIGEFYMSRYYDLIRAEGRAPEIGRLMAGGEKAARERDWLQKTLYADLAALLEAHAPAKSILDIGCGTGEFISYLNGRGFEAAGIEPSEEAAAMARKHGLDVFEGDWEGYLASPAAGRPKAGAVTLINVLEHVPEPVDLVNGIKQLLAPGGALVVVVPNDFSELQDFALQALGGEAWWVARPDHINYFDFDSMRGFLEALGLEVLDQQGTFPMELFLLMGDSYIGDPEAGARAHDRRRKFELALSGDFRQKLYRALGNIGVGRQSLTIARIPK